MDFNTLYGLLEDIDVDNAEELEEERDYQKEYETYHKSPKQKKRRAMRNQARAKMEKAGKCKKGDGKDVDHISHNVNNNSESNLKVMDAGKNRAKNLGKGGRPKLSKSK
jgi:hypothetical protein